MTYDPHKSTTEVRQGDGRRSNFRVLLLATGGAILALAIIVAAYFIFAPSPPPLQ
jgi:hypothetical protein